MRNFTIAAMLLVITAISSPAHAGPLGGIHPINQTPVPPDCTYTGSAGVGNTVVDYYDCGGTSCEVSNVGIGLVCGGSSSTAPPPCIYKCRYTFNGPLVCSDTPCPDEWNQ